MRICKFGEKFEVLGEERGGVFQRGENENPLLVQHRLSGGLDGIEVDVLDRWGFDLEGRVVVENDGSLKMCVPPGLLVLRHVHWGFRRAPAVEA